MDHAQLNRVRIWGIPATGRKIYWTENHFYRLENGQIQELWSEWSYQKLMDQLLTK